MTQDNRTFDTQINVNYGGFNLQTLAFQSILKMVPKDSISEALVRCIKTVDDELNQDTWIMHLYAGNTRISFFDASSSYQSDISVEKTHKILDMAGFNVEESQIMDMTEDQTFLKY